MRLGVIYKLSFKNCKYFLFGSSINFSQRKACYYSDLKRGNYANTFLQAVYNKYGKESIIFEIMQEGIPEDILTNIENIWIGSNCAKANDQKGGMNIADADKKIFSEQTRKKMSESRKKLIKNNPIILQKLIESNKKYKENRIFDPIICLYKDGTIKEFKSAKITAKELKISYSLVTAILRNIYDCYNYEITFIRKSNFDKNVNYDKLFINHRYKPVFQYDLNGKFIKTWESSRIAGKELNITPSTICLCCNGKYNQGKGFIWKYN